MFFTTMKKLRARALMCGEWAGINLENELLIDQASGMLVQSPQESGINICVKVNVITQRGDDEQLVTITSYKFSVKVNTDVPMPETPDGWVEYGTELRRKAMAVRKMNELGLVYRPKQKKGKT